MATPGFGTDVCEITGGWESSDLHPGADQLPLPPQPLSRLLPEAPGQSQPPILPSHEPQGVGDLQRSQQKCPEDQGERTGASAGNTLTTTPDFLCPRYYAIHSSAWSKPKLNGTQDGLSWGWLWVSGTPGAERGPSVRTSFGSQLGKSFLIPGLRPPSGKLSPELFSAEWPWPHTRTVPSPVSTWPT